MGIKGTCVKLFRWMLLFVYSVLTAHDDCLKFLHASYMTTVCCVFFLPGWSVFWAGVTSMRHAIWRRVCNAVDNAAVVITSLCGRVARRPASLLVQRFSRHVFCRSKHRGSSWWIADGFGQHSSKRNCCQCFGKFSMFAKQLFCLNFTVSCMLVNSKTLDRSVAVLKTKLLSLPDVL